MTRGTRQPTRASIATRRASGRTLVPMMLVVLGGPGFCAKRHATVDASGDASAAAVSASVAASASAAASAAASASASAAASAAAAAIEKEKEKEKEKATQSLTDIQWLIAHGVSVNPSTSGEGDVVSKCDAVASQRASVSQRADADADLTQTLENAAALCAFDVPLLTASEAIQQLRFSPSQASRLLLCGVSAREIARARAVKPNDSRVRTADARRAAVCK